MPVAHGTANAYNNHGCRCQDCRNANAAYHRAWRKRVRAAPVPNYIHGTIHGYNGYGCRCDRCREAIRLYHQARRAVTR